MVYPVGSIYLSVNAINPAILFGGTWSKIEGKFLLGSSGSYALGSQGGSADAVVVKHGGHIWDGFAPPPAGEDTYFLNVSVLSQFQDNRPYVLRAGNEAVLQSFEEGEDGTGKNMPPYLVVSIWKRTG